VGETHSTLLTLESCLFRFRQVAISATDKYRMERAQKPKKIDDAIESEVKPAPVQDADGQNSPLSWFSTFFKKS
jgi:hypothetical protein